MPLSRSQALPHDMEKPADRHFLRIHEIAGPGGLLPLSRSTWLNGVRAGRFPQPIHLTERVVVWRRSDIEALAQTASMPPPSPEQRLGSGWRKFLAAHPGTHAFSLAYNNILKARPGQQPYKRKVSLEQVHTDVRRLLRDLDRNLLGSHYTNRGLEQRRVAVIAFIENEDENIHVHGLATVPLHRGNEHEEFPTLVERLWRDHTGGYGSVDVQPIRDGGWAFYVCKQQQFGAALENPALIIFSQSPAQGKPQP